MKHDYGTLKAAGAETFLMEGPNSGGIAGLLLHDGLVYWFRADWNARIYGDPIPVAEFVGKYRDNQERGIRQLVAAALEQHPELGQS